MARIAIANIVGDPLVHFLDGSPFRFTAAEDGPVNAERGEIATARVRPAQNLYLGLRMTQRCTDER
jgi:hypothetical protein